MENLSAKKEIIMLDVVLQSVIGNSAFRAVLANGHEIVAFVRKKDMDAAASLRPGDSVSVCMSSYDMSKGRINF